MRTRRLPNSPLRTHCSQPCDFGLGIGLYFLTLLDVVILTLWPDSTPPNILYFSSKEYSQRQPGVTLLLKGSAICTYPTLAPCPCCDPNIFDSSRFATTTVDLHARHDDVVNAVVHDGRGPRRTSSVDQRDSLVCPPPQLHRCTIQAGSMNHGTLFLIEEHEQMAQRVCSFIFQVGEFPTRLQSNSCWAVTRYVILRP